MHELERLIALIRNTRPRGTPDEMFTLLEEPSMPALIIDFLRAVKDHGWSAYLGDTEFNDDVMLENKPPGLNYAEPMSEARTLWVGHNAGGEVYYGLQWSAQDPPTIRFCVCDTFEDKQVKATSMMEIVADAQMWVEDVAADEDEEPQESETLRIYVEQFG